MIIQCRRRDYAVRWPRCHQWQRIMIMSSTISPLNFTRAPWFPTSKLIRIHDGNAVPPVCSSRSRCGWVKCFVSLTYRKLRLILWSLLYSVLPTVNRRKDSLLCCSHVTCERTSRWHYRLSMIFFKYSRVDIKSLLSSGLNKRSNASLFFTCKPFKHTRPIIPNSQQRSSELLNGEMMSREIALKVNNSIRDVGSPTRQRATPVGNSYMSVMNAADNFREASCIRRSVSLILSPLRPRLLQHAQDLNHVSSFNLYKIH